MMCWHYNKQELHLFCLQYWTSQWCHLVRGVRAHVFTIQINHWASFHLYWTSVFYAAFKWELHSHGYYYHVSVQSRTDFYRNGLPRSWTYDVPRPVLFLRPLRPLSLNIEKTNFRTKQVSGLKPLISWSLLQA